MPTFFDAQNIYSGATASWSPISLATKVPSDAVAVFLTLSNAGNGYSNTILTKDSRDTTAYTLAGGDGGTLRDGNVATQIVSIGPTQTIDVYAHRYVGSAALTVGVYGYLTSKELATPITGIPKAVTAGIANEWQTVDLTSYISSYTTQKVYGVVLMTQTAGPYGGICGARPTGSAVTVHSQNDQPYQGCFAVQFNSSNGNKIDLYSSGATSPFYIVGFLIQNIVTNYNVQKNVSPTVANTWQTVSTLPAMATGGLYIVSGGIGGAGGFTYGLRPLTAPNAPVFGGANGGFLTGGIAAGSGQQVQGYLSNISGFLYEMGYWHPPIIVGAGGLFFGTNF